MKAPPLLTVALVSLLASLPLRSQSGLKVEPDPENVVASRLVGRWRVDAELTKRLGGRGVVEDVEFRRDDAVVDKIPAPIAAKLKEYRIYLAGIMVLKGKPQPFVLVQMKGNPHVVWFRERGGDPMGDAESMNVMLARAAQLNDDLLFIGGDFNNQPFTAYGRGKAPEGVGKDTSPEGTLKAALTDIARLLTAQSYKELIQTYAEPKELEKIEKEQGGIDRLASQFGGDKAARLLKLVEQIKGTDPVFNEDRTEANFGAGEGSKALRMRRVENRWYLVN
jgi:hypothetical protein